MKKITITLLCTPLLVLLLATQSMARLDLGITIDKNGISDFHIAISKHYNVAEKDIVIVSNKKVSDEELPVVFFVAKKAGVKSSAIIKLRLEGKSWQMIAMYYKLQPNIFFVDLKSKPAPPYGKAYGHYKKNKKHTWKNTSLSDDDFVNFVNLQFISGYYGYSPSTVIEMRSKGRGFVEINQSIKKQKNAKQVAAKTNKKKSNGKSKKSKRK